MKKIRLSTVSQVYEAFLHSRKALGAKEATLRTYRTSFLAVCKTKCRKQWTANVCRRS